jgi:NADH:ubiquinone oxidoreductase subunit 3 (subunit A)
MAPYDLLNPFAVFAVYLGVGALLYMTGTALAPALRDTGSKCMSYACGEIAPLRKLRPNYNFYHVAYLFTILHVGTLITCTSFGTAAFPLPLLYLGLILFGIAILIAR